MTRHAISILVCLSSCLGQEAATGIQLVSQASSIEIVFEGKCKQETGLCDVLLKNKSSNAALYFLSTVVPTEGAPVKNEFINGPIPAGGTFPFKAAEEGGLLIQAVIFDDGSYEGDRSKATYVAASQLGRWTQWEQDKPRISEIMALDASDDYKMAKLIEEVPQIPEDHALAKRRFKAIYPTLSLDDETSVNWLTGAMGVEKKTFLDAVQQYVKLGEQNPSLKEPLAQWWSQVESPPDPYDKK